MNATQALGRYGEELAVRTLTATGLHVLARNWRCGRTGEIDIVARDGDTLVICEVKTRREGAFEHPMAAVTPRKAERLRRLAACWLDRHGGPSAGPPGGPPVGTCDGGGVRIDLVGVVLPRRGAPVVTHAQGVA
ncbi:YraN family protein [Streptomyces sp. NPDC004327]|uniref:YraN family protein n=1 Tax=Streptomyces sp. NPDC004327 TaxID=3364699 RepID=UPI0036872EDC